MKDFAHLARFEKTLFSGAEWLVKVPFWTLLRLDCGVVYILSGSNHSELALGGLIVVPPEASIRVLASVVCEATLHGLSIKVSSLSGLLTLAERQSLEKEVAQECAPFRSVTGDQPLAVRMNELFQGDQTMNLPGRLGVVHSFAEWVSPLLGKAVANRNSHVEQNPKERLKQFLNSMPESELVDLSLADVAKQTCCCERHASRLFHQVCGCSFRKYISELRLKTACHLLAQGDYKIIDVALESGHSSLALFNYNFKNRFRMTPTEWRQRQRHIESRPGRAHAQLPMVAAILLVTGLLSLCLGWLSPARTAHERSCLCHNAGEISANLRKSNLDGRT